MPSLARSVPKPLKVPSLARSVSKPLKVSSLARSVPKPLKVGQTSVILQISKVGVFSAKKTQIFQASKSV